MERYPQLAPPAVTKERALQFCRLLRYLPEAEQTAAVDSWLTMGPAALRREVQGLELREIHARRRVARQRPPRQPRRFTGALWRDKLALVRQHLLFLRREGLIETLTRQWTPDNAHGYLREVGHVIAELQDIQARMTAVLSTPGQDT